MTKWEQFAKSRGIKKKRKDKMVFDQALNKWVPTHGKDSIREINEQRNIIKEHKGDDNPFETEKREKKIRKTQQSVNEQMNLLRKKGVDHKEIRKQQQKKDKREIEKVQKSSAGLGKFNLKN